jgi:hypothetical protein
MRPRDVFRAAIEHPFSIHHDAQDENELHHHSCRRFEHELVDGAWEGGNLLLVLFSHIGGAFGKRFVSFVNQFEQHMEVSELEVVCEIQCLIEKTYVFTDFWTFVQDINQVLGVFKYQ